MELSAETRTPRLNPFGFPTDTDFRFLLLIVAAISASLFFSSMTFKRIPGFADYSARLAQECAQQVGAAPAGVTLQDTLARGDATTRCMGPARRIQGAWMLGSVIVLLGIAGAIYWLYPVWKLRREGNEPFTAADDPDLVAFVGELCQRAGLATQPTILTNADMSPSGHAFGRWGRYYLVLNAGLILQYVMDPDVFRAVVLHELAHVRNGDVDKTYFTLALWNTFAAVTAIYLAVALIAPPSATNPGPIAPPTTLIWTTLLLGGLVYLMRNGVLRTREVYADLQASVWDGTADGLTRALEDSPDQPPARLAGRFGFLERLQRVHPEAEERRRLLGDTTPLFGIGFWEAFYTGLVVQILLPNVDLLVNNLDPIGNLDLETYLPVLAIAPLAAGVVALGTLRAAFVTLVRGEARRHADHLAVGLGLGVIVGTHVSTVGILLAMTQVNPYALTGFGVVPFEVAWGALVLAGVVLLFRWFDAAASVCAEISVSVTSPRWVNRIFFVVAGVLLALVLGIAKMVYEVRYTAGMLDQPGFAGAVQELLGSGVDPNALGPWLYVLELLIFTWVLLTRIVTLPVIALLWVVVLSAAWWNRGGSERGSVAARPTVKGWAFLDPGPPQFAAAQKPLRPRLALIGGAVAGGILWLLIWGLNYAGGSDASLVLLSLLVELVLAILAQIVVAWVVATRVERLPVVHGLFAASVVGCLTIVSLLALAVVTRTPMIATADTWALAVNSLLWGGMLLALPAAALGATMGRWARRRRNASITLAALS